MRVLFPLLSAALLASAAATEAPLPNEAELRAMTARFDPITVKVDLSALPASERTALAKMVEAAQIFDALYYRQVAPLNLTYLAQLVTDESPLGRARLHYFALNKGPWSRLDDHRAFLPGVGPKPPGGSFYPQDTTREEIEAWIKSLPADQQAAATGFFTTIRRNPAGGFMAVPYSVEYQPELTEAARLLNEAAAATTQPTLKSYLEKRARAFLTNDYYDSDVAWMELDATIEPTIGPYETYEDEWFNFKAAFEAFITLTDAGETAKLARFSAELQGLEDKLPIDPPYRRAKLGGLSPIRVVNVVFNSGDGNRGIQTAAFNLPNDERVVAAKGSKRVMLKNYQEAKFTHVLVPTSKHTLSAKDQPFVAFDPFFTHILMHELMHGLGPQEITVNGRATTVRLELKELNSTLEEAKADISGLWALQQLMDKGVLDKTQERAMYVTFLASSFRTLRFGLGDAHAKGMALQLNWLLDTGGFTIDADGRFGVDFAKIKQGVESLTAELMTLMDRLVVIRPQVKTLLARVKDLPTDIEPHFATEF
jgi:hypothetical protein